MSETASLKMSSADFFTSWKLEGLLTRTMEQRSTLEQLRVVEKLDRVRAAAAMTFSPQIIPLMYWLVICHSLKAVEKQIFNLKHFFFLQREHVCHNAFSAFIWKKKIT